MTSMTEQPTTETRMTAPEWLNLATIVSAETREKIENAAEAIESFLLDELGIAIGSSLEAQREFERQAAGLPEEVFEIVSEAVGLRKLRDLFLMIGGSMAGQIDTEPTESYFAELCVKYPDVAKRCGVQS